MPTSRVNSLVAVFIVSVLLLGGCGKEPQGTKSPEEVSDAVGDSVLTLFAQGEISTRYDLQDTRNRIASGLFNTMRTDSLTGADSLYYGRMLFWSGRDRKAKKIFEDLMARGGKGSRKALLELIKMNIEDGDQSLAETMMADYRRLYPPGPDNSWALYEESEDLGGRYVDMNRLDDAIRVYKDELNSLSYGTLGCSFSLMADLTNTCQEAGKLDVCREQLLHCRAGFEKSYAAYIDTMAYADSTQRAEDETPGRYESYIKSCDQLLRCIDLIGQPAPEFSFIYVFNADSSLTIGSLRGKVVILDFWTTSCVACLMGYEELRMLSKEYASRGLEIIGVTSLQGKYYDIETGEVEEGISREREIEITGEYIKSKDLTWPCAISEKNIFDNEYAVNAVPTYVMIDREGRIRMIRPFIGELEQKRRIIERLL